MVSVGFHPDGTRYSNGGRFHNGHDWSPIILSLTGDLLIKPVRGQRVGKIEGLARYLGGHPDVPWQELNEAGYTVYSDVAAADGYVYSYIRAHGKGLKSAQMLFLAEESNQVTATAQFGQESRWIEELPETCRILDASGLHGMYEAQMGVAAFLGADWSLVLSLLSFSRKKRTPSSLVGPLVPPSNVLDHPTDDFVERCAAIQKENLELAEMSEPVADHAGQSALPCRYRGGHPAISMPRAQITSSFWLVLDQTGVAISTDRHSSLSSPAQGIVAGFAWEDIE